MRYKYEDFRHPVNECLKGKGDKEEGIMNLIREALVLGMRTGIQQSKKKINHLYDAHVNFIKGMDFDIDKKAIEELRVR